MWITAKTAIHNENALYCFKREFDVCGKGNLVIKISAEARYKLYLNGELVSFGPAKANNKTKYYETVDLSHKLIQGKNVITADVLQLVEEYIGPLHLASVIRSGYVGLWLEGTLVDDKGETNLDTDCDNWYAAKYNGYEITPARHASYAGLPERVTDTKCGEFTKAVFLFQSNGESGCVNPWGELSKWTLEPRKIPQLTRIAKSFVNPVNGTVVEANSEFTVDLNAGALTTGYLNFDFKGGRGATVSVLTSECYEFEKEDGYYKAIRDDNSGILRGDIDVFELNENNFKYENFWFRTFRFVRVVIKSKDTPLEINDISYLETTYPLPVNGIFQSDCKMDKDMFDISIRTLKCCMHETYEDCPYFEQLQYAMDSRLQMLFSYHIANDDLLARQCIELFHSSKNSNGMLESRVPSLYAQIIPQFALHFVFMLSDFIRYRGDLQFVKKYLPTMDAVFNWFDERITEKGLVGETGYWPYFDWVDGWKDGVPPAEFDGGATVISLVYAYALQEGAYILESLGRSGDEYLKRSAALIAAVNKYCKNTETGMYKDGERYDKYCLHTQIWAIIAGATDDSDMLAKAFKMDIPKPSYSMAFFLMRALEKANVYYLADEALEDWRTMVKKHCTTWVEDGVGERSECHAWGSLPIYEFMAVNLGVKPLAPGFEVIGIKPYIGKHTNAEGNVCTVKGDVTVKWHINNCKFFINIKSPDGVKKVIDLPDGESIIAYDGDVSLECAL